MKIKVFFLLIIFSLITHAGEKSIEYGFNVEDVVVHGDIDQGLVVAGVNLINEVLAKDMDALSQYFGGLSKYAYKELYDVNYVKQFAPNKNPVFDVLSSIRSLNIKAIEFKKIEGKNRRVTLFYYDSDTIKLELPLNDKNHKLRQIKFTTCIFEKTKDGWKPYLTLFEGG